MDSCFGDVMTNPKAAAILAPLSSMAGAVAPVAVEESGEDSASASAISKEMMMAMMRYMPLRGIISFSGGRLNVEDLQKMVDDMNKADVYKRQASEWPAQGFCIWRWRF